MDAWLAPFQPLLSPAFTAWGAAVTWLEVAAFVLALAMVGLNMRVNAWAWPLAIVSSLMYGLLFLDSRLYGEASLQLFFVVVAAWGWWQWLRGRSADGEPLQVRYLGQAGLGRVLFAMALAWPALAWMLSRATDSDVPWWDAFPTAGSVIGQWLLGRKHVENWPAWLIVNLVSVALFAHKGLWLTVLLYALFVVLSAIGWRRWHVLADRPAAGAGPASQVA